MGVRRLLQIEERAARHGRRTRALSTAASRIASICRASPVLRGRKTRRDGPIVLRRRARRKGAVTGMRSHFQTSALTEALRAVDAALQSRGTRLQASAARDELERAFAGKASSEFFRGCAFDAAAQGRLTRFDPRAALVPYPDARGALERARARHLRIGVLSNFTLLDLRGSLAALGLADLVDAALSAAMIGVAKPAPEAYRAIAAALDVDPASCLFIDNRPEHVAGAAQVGMHALLLRRTPGAPSEGVISNLTELDRHLG